MRFAALLVALAFSVAGCGPSTTDSRDAGPDAVEIARLRAAGDFAPALELARRRARSAGWRRPAWQRADWAREVGTLERVEAAPPDARARFAAADRALLRADTLARLERWKSADSLVRGAAETRAAVLGPEHPEVLRAQSLRCRIARGSGAFGSALDLDHQTLAARKHVLGEHPETAESMYQTGLDLKLISGRLNEALSIQHQALAMRVRLFGPDDPAVAECQVAMGNLYRLARRWPECFASFDRALATQRRTLGPASTAVATTLADIGFARCSHDEWARGVQEFEQAARILRGRPDSTPRDQALAFGGLGVALRHVGRVADSVPLLEETARLHEELRSNSEPLVPRAFQYEATIYWELAAAQIESGDGDGAWRSMERAQARGLLDLLRARQPGDEPILPPTLAAVQTSLEPDEALIGWLDFRRTRGPEEYPYWCYALRRTGPIHWVRITRDTTVRFRSPGGTLDSVRATLRTSAAWPVRVLDTLAIRRAGQAIYRARVAPLEPYLAGARELIVSTPDVMRGLPLQALCDSSGRMLIDRFEITYTPSATFRMWRRARRVPPRPVTEWSALLLGDSEPAASPAGSGSAGLAHARDEVSAIARLIPRSTLLTGRAASEARLAALADSGALAHFDLLHIATHAVSDETRPERSALLLAHDPGDGSDGQLHPLEIEARWRLQARLVGIIGCGTQVSRETATESLQGFGQALLGVGAERVLTSMWTVDDASTSLLMQRFYRDLAGGPGARPMTPCAALREAQQWLRHQRDADGRAPYAHPAYWAGLVLIGD